MQMPKMIATVTITAVPMVVRRLGISPMMLRIFGLLICKSSFLSMVLFLLQNVV